MPLLSVIVPVYNKEKYIDECIQSILNQTFTDFELILVNDGSTDGSLAKCLQQEKADERVRVIDQQNGGVSAARNAGIVAATGHYIGFIDSDDTIEKDMFELLVENALAHKADISVCRLRVISDLKPITPVESPGVKLFTHSEALLACLQGNLDRSANNKIYRAELIRPIRFAGRINEDILFTCKAFVAAQTTVFQNTVKYNYIIRDNSASMRKFDRRYMEILDVSEKMTGLVGSEDVACQTEAKNFDVVANISILNLILLAGKNNFAAEYNTVVKKLNNYSGFINRSPTVRRKHRYAYNLFKFFPAFYTNAMYLYCWLTNAEAIKRT